MSWKQLIHNGVAFPPPYQPAGLDIQVRGSLVELSPLAEEMVYAWGKKRLTPYVLDPVFQENFLSDLRKLLPPEFNDVKMPEIDFAQVYAYLEKEEAYKKEPEVKKKLSAERRFLRQQLKEKYGFVIIDGKKTEVANWIVEPPGIFMGRGSHPMRGRWKPRVSPEDVVLNLSTDASVPPGHWAEIVHDQNSMWLAYWVDKLSQVRKYVWPSDIADVRQRRDKAKYEAARKLKEELHGVRKKILEGLQAEEEKTRRIATVCYLIDKLAMRVGDEKDPEEADTVGASTLRIEHVRMKPEAIELNFLGKDSVQWTKPLPITDESYNKVLANFQDFMKGKAPQDLLFDGINSEDVNKFLGRGMKGLTAKVFRTHHATAEVRDYLQSKDNVKPRDKEFEKLYYARIANLKAAITCNHKRTPPKTWESSFQKKLERLENLRSQKGKTPKQKVRLKERLNKLELDIRLQEQIREYNLNTSLRNYIDPRVYKGWAKKVSFDWQKIYSKTLLRKFLWANRAKTEWS